MWFSDPDACCRIRKVEPLARALKPFSAWINGRKRFQGGARAEIPVVEEDGAKLKFNPFANVSREEIEAIYELAQIAAASLGRLGIPFGRMHAVFEPDRAGRERARWPLARQSQDRMRHPYDENFLSSRISEDIEAAEPQTMKCGFVD